MATQTSWHHWRIHATRAPSCPKAPGTLWAASAFWVLASAVVVWFFVVGFGGMLGGCCCINNPPALPCRFLIEYGAGSGNIPASARFLCWEESLPARVLSSTGPGLPYLRFSPLCFAASTARDAPRRRSAVCAKAVQALQSKRHPPHGVSDAARGNRWRSGSGPRSSRLEAGKEPRLTRGKPAHIPPR